MSRSRFRSLLLVLSLCFLWVRSDILAAPPFLQLVDDQGKPIASEVEVCFRYGLENICAHGTNQIALARDELFDSVRAEGPRHGPLYLRRGELQRTAAGDYLMAVPRKAWLTIRKLPPQKVKLSLYDHEDDTFRKPAFQLDVPASGGLWLPAGSYVASLAAAERAPDLHVLIADPGKKVQLTYRPRAGWSLLLRVLAAGTGLPVGKAAVTVAAHEGYGQGEMARGEAEAGGLVLLSGFDVPLARAQVTAAGFQSAILAGLTTTPGTFTFRTAALARGGDLVVEVTIDGQRAVEVRCSVQDQPVFHRGERGLPTRSILVGRTDEQGRCVGRNLPAGNYVLRIYPGPDEQFAEIEVAILDEKETAIAVNLTAIAVAGNVSRGREPFEGATIEVYKVELPSSNVAEPAAKARSDDAGDYSTRLWLPGTYLFKLQSPEGTPVAVQRIDLMDESEVVDFELLPFELTGRVMDQDEAPVAQANVTLIWRADEGGARYYLGHSDEQGWFSFALEQAGVAELRASRDGFEEAQAVQIPVSAASAPVPAVLRLKKEKGTLRGRLVAAGGTPVAGAVVGSYVLAQGWAPRKLGLARTDLDGRFELVGRPEANLRILATGPGCPLSRFAAAALFEEAPIQLKCPAAPAGLNLTLVDEGGRPQPHSGVFLKQNGEVVPQEMLRVHLAGLGLSPETDGSGNLVLVGLAPGTYELYLFGAASEESIALGLTAGLITSIELEPLATPELAVTLGR